MQARRALKSYGGWWHRIMWKWQKQAKMYDGGRIEDWEGKTFTWKAEEHNRLGDRSEVAPPRLQTEQW